MQDISSKSSVATHFMKRISIAFFVVLFGVVLSAALIFGALGHHIAAPKVYTVSELHTAMKLNPKTWVGRTILVRGTALTLPTAGCHAHVARRTAMCPPQWIVYDATKIGSGGLIRLTLVLRHPILALLSSFPVLRAFVPHAQEPRMLKTAIYRVRILGRRINSPPHLPEIDALLLDAAPGAIPPVPASMVEISDA